MNVAVIPARGGSKRVPRKNVRMFAGKPMIAHAIGCALNSNLFARVIVSTDDEEIASIAREHGAETPFRRPPQLSNDHAGTVPVISHAVRWLVEQGFEAASVCCLYATAPFVQADDLARGLAVLNGGAWRYVFSATTFAAPVLRAFRKDHQGGVEMLFPANSSVRSQDLESVLHDAGQFYWGGRESWLDSAPIFDAQSTVIQVSRSRVQDIDTEEDWARAETMAAALGLALQNEVQNE